MLHSTIKEWPDMHIKLNGLCQLGTITTVPDNPWPTHGVSNHALVGLNSATSSFSQICRSPKRFASLSSWGSLCTLIPYFSYATSLMPPLM